MDRLWDAYAYAVQTIALGVVTAVLNFVLLPSEACLFTTNVELKGIQLGCFVLYVSFAAFDLCFAEHRVSPSSVMLTCYAVAYVGQMGRIAWFIASN